MGQIKLIQCEACDYSTQLCEGVGFIDRNPGVPYVCADCCDVILLRESFNCCVQCSGTNITEWLKKICPKCGKKVREEFGGCWD